jgi:hypothetical protein
VLVARPESELVGVKGLDGDGQRLSCIERDIFPNIPSPRNRVEPWPFLPEGCVERNKVECLLGKAKQFRRYSQSRMGCQELKAR